MFCVQIVKSLIENILIYSDEFFIYFTVILFMNYLQFSGSDRGNEVCRER